MTRLAAALLDSGSMLGADPAELERRAALLRRVMTGARLLLGVIGIGAYLSVAAAPPLANIGF